MMPHSYDIYVPGKSTMKSFLLNGEILMWTVFLNNRNFNVEKASTLLQGTLDWRKKFGLDNLDAWKDVIAKENATGKSYVRGYDKHGHPIVYMKPKYENTKDHDGNIKHLVYTMERAVACAEKTGQGKLTLIIDFDGYSLSNAPPMKTSRETLNILQDHYPERLFRAYLIHTPYIFYGFYQVISPFIDPITKEKIVMLTNAELANPTSRFFVDIDKTVAEKCVGGDDERPFVSASYLSASMQLDYNSVLDAAATTTTSTETAAAN